MSLPTPPQRSDGPTTFADRGDAFMAALPVFETRMEEIDANVTALEATTVVSAAAAVAASNAAVSATNAPMWVSGTFAFGDVCWSPLNSLSYRCKIAGVRATDPSLDATNWAQLAATSDFVAAAITTERSAAVTMTNKTLALGSNTVSGTLAQLNTAVTDADLASLAGSETLTNKTLSAATNNIEARSLKSATTTVSVSAATAPTSGQVLTASSGTVAAWATPTAPIPYVTPGTAGNLLTSNGSAWVSQATAIPAYGAIGSYVFGKWTGNYANGATIGTIYPACVKSDGTVLSDGSALSGSWRLLGYGGGASVTGVSLFQRIS